MNHTLSITCPACGKAEVLELKDMPRDYADSLAALISSPGGWLHPPSGRSVRISRTRCGGCGEAKLNAQVIEAEA